MNIKEFYNKALFYLTVPKCICCKEPLDYSEKALCKDCFVEYKNKKSSQCSVCFKPLNECLCVNDYLDRHFVHKLVKVFRYKRPDGPNDVIVSNELIYQIKRGYRRDLVDFIADELEEAVKNSIDFKKYIITNVPRKRSRARHYGLDHSAVIAGALAAKLGIEYIKTLKSISRLPQKKTHGEDRFKNAQFDYLKKSPDLSGKRVLLLDDIVTTGASMGNVASMLKGIGAKEIVGISLSIAYRDKYLPFEKGYK